MPNASPIPVRRSPAAVHHRQGDPEVADHRVAGLDQDVLGLDVPVNHSAPVGEFQDSSHRAREPQRLVDRKLWLAPQPVR